MKILLVTSRDHNRDVDGMQMMQLALELSRQGNQVTVVYLFAPNTSRQFSAYNNSRVVVIRSAAMENRKRFLRYRFAMDLRRIIKDGDFDLIHTFDDALPIALIASLGTAVRIVANCDRAARGQKLANFCYHLGKVSLVVATSAEIRDTLMEQCGVDGDKVPVIYNGVDLARFHPAAEAAGLRQDLDIDAHALVIACEHLTVEQTTQKRNLLALIDAFTLLVAKSPRCVLLLRNSCEKRIKNEYTIPDGLLKHVQFSSADCPREEFLAIADLYISHNAHPGNISHDILEAASMRVPVIAADAGANCEFIHHRKTGLLADVSSDSAILEAIQTVVDNPDQARTMVNNAYQSVVARMGAGVRADQLSKLYDQAVNSVPKRVSAIGHAKV